MARWLKFLKYQSDDAIIKERWAKCTVKSVPKKLLSVRSDIDKHRQRLPFYTKWLTAGVTVRFSAFLYSLSTEVRKLMEKQRIDTEKTVKADLEAIEDFSRSNDSNLSRTGLSS